MNTRDHINGNTGCAFKSGKNFKGRKVIKKMMNVDSWRRIAEVAGMKYAPLTARHDGGFSLWDSEAPRHGKEFADDVHDPMRKIVVVRNPRVAAALADPLGNRANTDDFTMKRRKMTAARAVSMIFPPAACSRVDVLRRNQSNPAGNKHRNPAESIEFIMNNHLIGKIPQLTLDKNPLNP